jgi:hypothetical protein
MFKGKGNKDGAKGKGQGKGRQWREPEWTPLWSPTARSTQDALNSNNNTEWLQPWSPPEPVANSPQNAWTSNDKGKGNGKSNGSQAPLDAQTLWCDIHQQYGHSTDWCFNNPHRTGGPPKREWCDNHQKYGHSTAECRKGSGPPSPTQGKGKGNKGSRGERNWKSQNFPAGYKSDQVTPALRDESMSQTPPQSS